MPEEPKDKSEITVLHQGESGCGAYICGGGRGR